MPRTSPLKKKTLLQVLYKKSSIVVVSFYDPTDAITCMSLICHQTKYSLPEKDQLLRGIYITIMDKKGPY
jgi:hypothetical protein